MNASAAAAVPRPSGQSIVNPDGTTNRIWLSSYVKGVPADIDVNKYQSLGQYFDECVNKYRQRPGFVSIGTEMSNDRLDRLVTQFAAWLQGQGVKKGDRVAIMLPNTFQYPVCLFAVLKLGAVVVNINPLYTSRELAHALNDSGAETIIVMETFAKTLQDAMPGTKVKRIVLTQIGDLLSDGRHQRQGTCLELCAAPCAKDGAPLTACRVPAGCAMCSRKGPGPSSNQLTCVPMTWVFCSTQAAPPACPKARC
jgi:long-chain acyl-CoA synthetase